MAGDRWRSGYGKIWYQGKKVRVHRLLWGLEHGAIPEGIEICHTCDNPPCVNPQHLYAGTHQQNMADRKARGRYAPEFMPVRLFTLEEVVVIRAQYAAGLSASDIARERHITPSAALGIITGKQYTDVVGAVQTRGMPKGEENKRHKLREEEVRAIRQLYANGEATQCELAHRYGVSQPLIANIVHRKTWKHLEEA